MRENQKASPVVERRGIRYVPRKFWASVPLPKFVVRRGTIRHELRKQRGTGKYMISSAAFRFEVPKRACRDRCRNFKSAALASARVAADANNAGYRWRRKNSWNFLVS